MKKYLTTLLVAVYVLIANAADDPTTFTFTGNVNDSWIVTENWTPFYPGTQIIEGDLIVIDADCRATAGDVEIGGGLIINSGVAFNTNGADVTIVGSAIVHGILNVANSSTFQNDGLTSVEAGGAIMNDGTVASNADFHVEGSIQNDP